MLFTELVVVQVFPLQTQQCPAPPRTLTSLASIAKVAAPRSPIPISLPAAVSWRSVQQRSPEGPAPGSSRGTRGELGARLPSPLWLSRSAPAALHKLHKYSWRTEGNVTVPADYRRLS